MNRREVLNQLFNKELTTIKAYKSLYGSKKTKKLRRAHFIKVKIIIPESKKLNMFLGCIFLLPISVVIFKVLLSFAKEQEDSQLSHEQLLEIVSIKDVKVDIALQEGTIIRVKTM